MRYTIRYTKPTEAYVAYPRSGHVINMDSVVVINKKGKKYAQQ